jgi:DNA-directed RNA polymerase subunit delta
MTIHRSMLETAIGVMKRKRSPQPFMKIYDEVAEELQFSEAQKTDNVARFYSDLSLSAYFVYTGDNNWDLKERQPTDMWDKDASFFIDPEELKARKAERAEKRALLRKEKAAKADLDLDIDELDDTDDELLFGDDLDDDDLDDDDLDFEDELDDDLDDLDDDDDDDIDDSEIEGLDIEDIDEEEIDIDEDDDFEDLVDDYEELYDEEDKK